MSRKKKPLPVLRKDPVLKEALDLLNELSPKQIAERSGNRIGAPTIYNWRRGKVRCPISYTLDAALFAAGYERVIRRRKKSS